MVCCLICVYGWIGSRASFHFSHIVLFVCYIRCMDMYVRSCVTLLVHFPFFEIQMDVCMRKTSNTICNVFLIEIPTHPSIVFLALWILVLFNVHVWNNDLEWDEWSTKERRLITKLDHDQIQMQNLSELSTFYRKFVCDYTALLHPLASLLKKMLWSMHRWWWKPWK